MDSKDQVKEYWNKESCGEVYGKGSSEKEYYDAHREARYSLEPYILDFAKFTEGHDKDVLEVGVGMGADHVEWAKSNPRTLTGVDLTERAVEHTRKRLAIYGLTSNVLVSDAENLPFEQESFDLVYSWGVLHHSPATSKSIDEVHRVLRTGGMARIMIYHKYSLTGYMLWMRYGLAAGRPGRSLEDIYAHHLESPGTKAYSRKDAQAMFKNFSKVDISTRLSFGDLLEGEVGQRHQGLLLTLAKKLWPRWFLKNFFARHGLAMFIEAVK